MIAKEGAKRHYLGWRGKVLLASIDQLRLATVVECAAHDTIAKDAVLVERDQREKMNEDARMYQDIT